MPEITQEQILKFATVCGWTEIEEILPGYRQGFDPGNAFNYKRPLPDFLSSKDAAIEALERFCGERGYEITKLHKDDRKSAEVYECYIYYVEEGMAAHLGVGGTFNESIIKAVLKAAESREES